MNNFKAKWTDLEPWFAAAWLVLTGNWAAAELKDAFSTWLRIRTVDGVSAASVGVYVSLFFSAVCWLYLRRETLFTPRTRLLRNEEPPPREHLILFLSDLPSKPLHKEGVPEGLLLTGDLQKDLEAMVQYKETNTFWRWEMPLLGIRHHLGVLKSITLICSPESLPQVHWFGQILNRTYEMHLRIDSSTSSGDSWLGRLWVFSTWLLRKTPTALSKIAVRVFVKEGKSSRLMDVPLAELHDGGWNFDQFDELSLALIKLLNHLKTQNIRDHQVMVDFTGGLKVTSVVAASATFNRRIKAQYVHTKTLKVIGYDMLLTSSLTEGMGW